MNVWPTASERPAAWLVRMPVLGWVTLQGSLLFLGVGSLVWNALALLLWLLLPAALGRRVGRAGIAHGYRLFWRVTQALGLMRIDVQALDALRDERGLIVVANHPSLFDAMIIVARLPRSACIMKASLMRNPLLAPAARLARYIRNDSPLGLVRSAVHDLRNGGQLVVFPEGTRTTRPGVNPLRPGVTMISQMAGAPIQCVHIETASPYLRKGWPLWRKPPLPVQVRVRIGRRFAPAGDANAALAEIEHYFMQQATGACA